ncbi:pentapeptide repeat-containing protein [Trichothermofontia sichuanensis B231]|uniref:pentapeptide repeat-containing protein n=1 Tax=Trichothermofontia sichuanensis TaxID=3045816 RepID=UPI0022484F5F|nr:pentapeptide repeat-containing protein [Trichothermofontia sichuanensis]UZQ55284.1 pentapeptide repeat-containing protein [Trichothermofontia sichuanensis B231]
MKVRELLRRYRRGQRDFQQVELLRADLAGASLEFIDLRGAQLERANLTQAQLIGAELWQTNLTQANLQRVNLIGADLRAAQLYRADCTRGMFCGASLNTADLSYAILDEASLCGADLRAADLTGASLRGTNLKRADLRGAILQAADLTGAELEEADLTDAILPSEADRDQLLARVRKPSIYLPMSDEEVLSELPPVTNGVVTGEVPAVAAEATIVVPAVARPLAPKAAEELTIEAEWTAFLQADAINLFQPNNQEEGRGRILRSLLLRKGHTQLRQKLLDAYQQRCVVSGCTAVQVLEVAYILPYAGEKTNHPTNCLLLRADLHVLFDLHLLAIDPCTSSVLIAPWLVQTIYGRLNGRKVNFPSNLEIRPSAEALATHLEKCQWQRESMPVWPEVYSL